MKSKNMYMLPWPGVHKEHDGDGDDADADVHVVAVLVPTFNM